MSVPTSVFTYQNLCWRPWLPEPGLAGSAPERPAGQKAPCVSGLISPTLGLQRELSCFRAISFWLICLKRNSQGAKPLETVSITLKAWGEADCVEAQSSCQGLFLSPVNRRLPPGFTVSSPPSLDPWGPQALPRHVGSRLGQSSGPSASPGGRGGRCCLLSHESGFLCSFIELRFC